MGRLHSDRDSDRLGMVILKDVGFCALIAVVLTALNVPLTRFSLPLALNWFIGSFTISLGIGMTISNLYRVVFPWAVRRWPGGWTRTTCHVAFALFSVAFGGELAIRVLGLIGFQTEQMRPSVFKIGMVVVIVLTTIMVTYERLRERARRTEMQAQEAQQRALRAELQTLQARTDPHFLFNTLNTVAGLIDEDPAAAERMLERLSTVFRYALEGSHNRWVRLEEEWGAVRDYLEVESIRFGERLRVEMQFDDTLGKALVPPLVLQPLVENAVLHGIAGQVEGGVVRVAATRDDGSILLTVEDNGPGPGQSRHTGSGQGLSNLSERLRLLYGERASFSSGSSASGGYRATISLPASVTEETS